MIMENPFKYGGIVRSPYFADREDEIKTLELEVRNLNRIFLVSPRRYGKTCLLFNLMDHLKSSGIASAYIDLNAYPNIIALAGAYTGIISNALETNKDKLLKLFAGLKKLRPKGSIEYEGATFSISLEAAGDEKDSLSALLEGMNFVHRLAQRKKKKLVVIIDEFSDLSKYNGQILEKALRSEIQTHEKIAYIFSGSEQSVMLSMINDRSRAFYKMGRIMQLKPIDRKSYMQFITNWLKKGSVDVDPRDLGKIFDLGDDVPHNIQRLCHNLWNLALEEKQKITGDVIEALPRKIVEQDSPHYEMLWSGATQQQKAVLIALAKNPSIKPFSKEFSLRYRVAPSSTRASLTSLVSKGLLYLDLQGSYRFTDTFMPYWITSVLKA
jgi:hypothetical protein